jgi:hypothetical protein
MAITNYSELQTSITKWLSRTGDTNLATLGVDFIMLAEAKFNRGFRTRNMETATSLTPTAGVCTLPVDYLELRRIYIDTDTPIELEYLTPENFYLKYPIMSNDGVSPSRYYTIEGSSIILSESTTSNNIKILYYQKIPALSISNTTNWLLTAHPDLYLAESLSEAYDVIKNEALAQKWLNKSMLIGQQIIESDKHGKYSGSVMRVIAA